MATKDGAFELGTSGLQAAIDAAREALPTETTTDKIAVVAPNAVSLRHQLEDGLIAVGHALWWIGALEDWHRDRLGDRPYFDIRPEIVGGLRYVRNLVAHQLARTIQVGETHGTLKRFDGESWAPVTLADMLEAPSETAAAVTVEEARWVQLQELPDPSKEERHGRDLMYRDRVAGEQVVPVLDEAGRWLTEGAFDATGTA